MNYSLSEIKEILSSLIEINDGKGIPIVFTFIEKISTNYFTTNKDNQVLCNVINDNNTFYLQFKPLSKTLINIANLPIEKIIKISIHEDYKRLIEIPNISNQEQAIIKQLNQSVGINERKTFVFSFIDDVYLPYYNLNPQKEFRIDVGKKMLSEDKSRNFLETIVFYIKSSVDNRFLLKNYFPFEKCLDISEFELHVFNKSIDKISIESEFKINIRSTKTLPHREIEFSSEDLKSIEKTENHFPIALVFKTDKKNTRTHDNCLICGTKLFAKEQIYVHLLEDGNIITDLSAKVDQHFSFFPVGNVYHRFLYNIN